jgi:hypothetical protein
MNEDAYEIYKLCESLLAAAIINSILLFACLGMLVWLVVWQ